MLAGLFVTPTVTAITEALDSARADGTIVVIGHAKLAAALAAKRVVVAIGMTEREAKKLGPGLGPSHPDTSSLEAGSIAAVIGVDITEDASWHTTLRAWTRVVCDGGAIVIVDRGHAAEASRRALCAGLTEIEQRHAGRTVVTSGLVTQLASGHAAVAT